MVRKRSRASRKHYESDDNDSDSDFALDDPPTGPVQKKYSLRQRKRPLFTEDFDYDDDGEEIEPPKPPSDDEDFEVEKELELDEAPDTEYVDKTTYINHYEPETDDIPEDAEGLIDFEDMIRADIVVNKNRIDYDNIIQKTEIKVQPIEEVQPVKSKRGRKPKNRPVEEIDSGILEPETEVQEEAEFEDKNDKDYNPDEELSNEEVIDCEKILQTELKESAPEEILAMNETILNSTNSSENKENETTEIEKEQRTSDNIPAESNIAQEPVIQVNDNTSKEKTHINGKIASNKVIEIEEKPLEVRKRGVVGRSTENEDDDVVLIEDEKKCEVIVLDD